MKTRENELHEPIIVTESHTYENMDYSMLTINAICPICGNVLGSGVCTDRRVEYLEEVKASIKQSVKDNYCPNCGTRLKEIEV